MDVTRNDPSPIRIMIAVMQLMGAVHILLSRGLSHYPGYAKIARPSKQRKKGAKHPHRSTDLSHL
jgi:hypothetical protein